MTTAAPSAHSGWKITGQRQDRQLPNGAAQFVDGVTVSFETNAGNAGSVFVPLGTYTPEQVAAAVSARAAQLDAISTLSAPPSS